VVLPAELVGTAETPSDIQPLPGQFEIAGDELCFVPRFPFLDGTTYALLIEPAPDEAGDHETWMMERPAREGAPSTRVVAIYPTAGEVPVNLLKLYVHFSAPMSEGWALRALRVRRADDGRPIEGVFLPSETELWDRDHRRLTILLDPGRIKRGLVPHEQAGYPLVEGVPIVVSVEPSFRDARSLPLVAGAERRYRVGPLLRRRVDPRAWHLDSPGAGTAAPLGATFERPLDQALLEDCLWVHDASGAPLEGRAETAAGQRSWRFVPAAPWREGRYELIVEPRIEDLAGNSLVRVFDRDLTRAEDEPLAPRPVAIGFTCT
jgi:hypothetical protein